MPKKSATWKYFSHDESESNFAHCNICRDTKNLDSAKVNRADNTTNLWRHLKDYHPKIHDELIKEENKHKNSQVQTTIQINQTTNNIFTISNPLNNSQIDRLIAEQIIYDLQPYKFVDDIGFKNFVKFAYPKYTLPGRKHFVKYIDELYESKQMALQKITKSIKYCAITTDIWTARNQESYITFTCHYIDNGQMCQFVLESKPFGNCEHTGDNIHHLLNAVLAKYELLDKVVSVVTDNAKNIVNGVSDSCDSSNKCLAHTLQLVVKDALNLQHVDIVLSKCRAIVGHFRRSSQAAKKLQLLQEEYKLPEHKLIQEVSTRWNSTFYMIERLIEQREAVIKYFLKNETDVIDLSSSEWKFLEGLIEILHPIESITKTLEGDKYCTASLVVPHITAAIVCLKSFSTKTLELKQVRDTLLSSLDKRLKTIENDPIMSIACLLDPRIKENGFRSTDNRRKAVKKLLSEMMDTKQDAVVETQIEQAVNQPQSKKRKFDFWNFIDEQKQDKYDTDLQYARETNISKELDYYLRESPVHKKTDILLWWEENKAKFPTLYLLTAKYLCVPATSAPAERVFSKAGEIVSNKRSRISPKHVNTLIFLNKNLRYL